MASSSLVSALLFSVLAPLSVLAQGPSEDAQSGPSAPVDKGGDAAGAVGSSSDFKLSRGAMIAIIIVAALVGVGGIASAILFYIAKKRQWEIRKSIRRSARRLTGNFSASKTNLAASGRRQKGASRLADNGPETSRPRTADLEKGSATSKVKSSFELEPATPKPWSSKVPGLGGKKATKQ
ncbi:MAG: hypothetical protein M1832_001600 [Thelocarpon impressellum]|nr:MAG: hypothetical protein M1832_001600 [Thelocarpon impressellum]